MAGEYDTFVKQIKEKLRIDLSLYKEAQMKRRLTSLRNKRGYKTFTEYFEAIDQDITLLSEFVDRITINVSEFYRNPKRWEVLKSTIFPSLVENKNELSIWSAACSTGEEPYSIAMMLQTYFPNVTYHITATDIDQKALEKAKAGVYSKQSLKDLPIELKNRYFTENNGLYYIADKIKKEIKFIRHDLLSDKYPEQIDLIVCRNVLIYFTDIAKEQIYQKFSQALVNNGVLFVGSTEQIFTPQLYNLKLIDTFFYQKSLEK